MIFCNQYLIQKVWTVYHNKKELMHNINPATDYFKTTNNCINERNDNCNPTLKWVGVGGKCPQTK